MRLPAEFLERARSQLGIVRADEALKLGLTEAAIRRRVAAGQLERVGTHCLRLPGYPETWRQLLQVGLLDLGDDALVARRSAACLLGLDGFPEGPLQFLVPRSCRDRQTVGEVHSAGRLPLIDRVEAHGFRATSAARTIVDLAAEAPMRELENAIDSSLRLGWTSEPFLRRRLADLRHRGRAGVRALDRAIDGAGGHSRLEREFLALVRRGGLPKPACQRIHRQGGRFVARTDFSWDVQRVIAEVAGHGTHAARQQRRRDAQRQAELGVLGWLVLPFTYEQVIEDAAWVLGIVRRALAPGPFESADSSHGDALAD